VRIWSTVRKTSSVGRGGGVTASRAAEPAGRVAPAWGRCAAAGRAAGAAAARASERRLRVHARPALVAQGDRQVEQHLQGGVVLRRFCDT